MNICLRFQMARVRRCSSHDRTVRAREAVPWKDSRRQGMAHGLHCRAVECVVDKLAHRARPLFAPACQWLPAITAGQNSTIEDVKRLPRLAAEGPISI